MSGLTFEFVPKATKKEAIESVEKGKLMQLLKLIMMLSLQPVITCI